MVGHILNTSSKSVGIDQLNVVSIEQDVRKTSEQGYAEEVFAIIDSRKFFGECIRRSVQSAFTRPVETYSSVREFENRRLSTPIGLIIMSLSEDSLDAAADALQALSGLAPKVPIVVLSDKSDLEFARAMMGRGAKGYIPVTMGFEIAIEAVRFVLAGGDLCASRLFLHAKFVRSYAAASLVSCRRGHSARTCGRSGNPARQAEQNYRV
jgi:DNA-binding NarL/FixJ family response regulator